MLAFKKHGIPLSTGGIATHFYISSFPSEIEAFKSYLKTDPRGSVMIDTYSFDEGLKNIVKVAKEMEKEGKKLRDISVDSGDLVALFKKTRKYLDDNGLNYVTLSAFSNLDEYKIKELKENGANYDFFGVATEVVTSRDCPVVEIVYKIAEIQENGIWRPKAKFSPGKISLCGRKQIYRVKIGEHYVKDIIGLEGEDIFSEKLLQPIMLNGKLVCSIPTIEETRSYVLSQYKQFSPELFDIGKENSYSVELSENLNKAMAKLKQEFNIQ